MKATGIVRRIDDLGRVVLPKGLRQTFNMQEGDALEIFTEDNAIILQKYQPGCACAGCNQLYDLVTVGGITVCRTCAKKFGKAAAQVDQ